MCICHFWENVSIQFNLLNEIFYPIFLSRFICLKYSWIAGKGRAGFAISRNCSRSRQISVKSAFCFRYFSCFRSLSNRPINYKNILVAAENITRKRLQGKYVYSREYKYLYSAIRLYETKCLHFSCMYKYNNLLQAFTKSCCYIINNEISSIFRR